MRAALAIVAALSVAAPAAAQTPSPAAPRVLEQPDFADVTRDFSGEDRLEFAAHLSMVLRQHEQAIPMYEAILKREPNRADLWAALALAYNHANEPREAYDAAGIAVTLAPYAPYFRGERGIAAFLLGRHREAIEDLTAYVDSASLNARGRYYLGLAQAAAGDLPAARASLLRARALNPALEIPTDYYLGLIAAERGQLATSRALLARSQAALEGSGLPIEKLVGTLLQRLDGAVVQRLAASIHESDVRFAPQPGASAAR
jgi:tetratricopeptide (TPR) repeat protein